jgi:hypothetical protein
LPERFDFPVLVEIPDDQDIRAQLVERVLKIFSQWFSEVEHVLLLDCKTSELTTQSSVIADLNSCFLSSSQILFVYLTGVRANEKLVLGISKNVGVVVYTVSLPDTDIMNHPEELIHLLSGLFSEISSMGLRCIVTGGGELEMEEPLKSISGVIRAASHRSSLVEYLCCDKKDAAQLNGFALLQENGNVSVFRRTR